MQAKSNKNKSTFNKAIKWLIKYNEVNKLRELADEDEKEYDKLCRKCENLYDKFSEFLYELPKYEQERILNSNLYLGDDLLSFTLNDII